MIPYAEMIAHSCKSVHVPGVAWPEYVEREKRGQSFDRRSPEKIKTQILNLLKYGAALTTQEIRDEIHVSLSAIQASVYKMRICGVVKLTKRKIPKGKPINVYSMGDVCKLH